MNAHKSALLIIDMQNDIIRDRVKPGEQIIPHAQKLLHGCRKKGMHIVHLMRNHRHSGVDVERSRLKHFHSHPYLVQGTEGVQIIKELTPLPTEYVVYKNRFSGFFQTDLLMILMRLGVTSLAVCGVQTPNCIRCTVTDALAYDFDVSLIEDAIAAQTPEIHQANLFDMHNMGAHIQTVADFLKMA